MQHKYSITLSAAPGMVNLSLNDADIGLKNLLTERTEQSGSRVL